MAETVTMPKLGFDMAEGTLIRWVKAEGESVNKGDILAEIETDKATVEVESSFTGVIHRRLVEQGAVVPVGTPIVIIAAPGERVTDEPAVSSPVSKGPEVTKPEPQKVEPPSADQKPTVNMDVSGDRVKASPLAKRIAGEFGVSLVGITGSGPGGRIIKKDIELAMADIEKARASITEAAAEIKGELPTLPISESWTGSIPVREDEQIPLTKLRSAIARRMVESKQAPHFYVTHDYDMAALMKLRKELNEFLPENERFSVNDFIIKGVALALRQFPNINSSFGETAIVRHGAVNIGVAVAVESGLLTVVCRDADIKPLRVISAEIKAMAARARAGKVKPEDIEGSTFSISNLGMFDVEDFAAIINSPEAAILAVSSVKQVPVVVDDNLKVGTRMKATLSADHRVTDGAEAAQFMQKLALYLEKPVSLIL